jgi:hypothetical protein
MLYHKGHEEIFVSFVIALAPFVVNSLKRIINMMQR